RKNNSIQIRVKDNGMGINLKEINSPTKGSGLSSIRNRLSLYNGKIKFESQPDKGTTVYISLDDTNVIL
ncbi:MAG TPA: ATP-binding protein, partial [Sphingobacteriaceae bacterium]